MMKQKDSFEDDGRTIADMNIEGTPWYNPQNNSNQDMSSNRPPITRKETFYLLKGALSAGLLIGVIFIAAFLIFILFCTRVWFR